MNEITIVIPGRPVPCPRPRVVRNRAYYPKAYDAWRKAASWQAKSQLLNGGYPIKGRVSIEIMVSGVRKNADLDNVQKAGWDMLTGIVYEDDRQIDDARIFRVTDGEPRMEIRVWHYD